MALKEIMKAIAILVEERHKKAQLKDKYEKEIDELPKGSVNINKLKDGRYYYRRSIYCAETKKTFSEHIGKDKAVGAAEKEKTERRRHLEITVKELKKDIEAIDKMLAISNKRQQEIEKASVSSQLREMQADATKNDNSQNQVPAAETKSTQNVTKTRSNPNGL